MATTYTYTGTGTLFEIDMTNANVSDSGNFRYVDGNRLVSQYEANRFKVYASSGDSEQRATRGWLKNKDSSYPYFNNVDLSSDNQLIPAKSLYRKFKIDITRNVNYFNIHGHSNGSVGSSGSNCILITKLKLSFYNNKDGYGNGYANGATSSSPRATYEYTSGINNINNGYTQQFKLWGSGINTGWFQIKVEITVKAYNSSHTGNFPIWVRGKNVRYTVGTNVGTWYGNNAQPGTYEPPITFNTPSNSTSPNSNLTGSATTSGTTLTMWFTINTNGLPSNINPFTSELGIKL